MTPEKREELLKNSLVLRVQKDPSWARDVEEAVREELCKTISSWLRSTEKESIGPKEVILYLERLAALIRIENVVEVENEEKEVQ